MKKGFKIIVAFFCLITSIMAVGCKDDTTNYIKLDRYFMDSVSVSQYKTAAATDLSLANAINSSNLAQYTEYKFTGQKKWISELFVNTIKLGFVSNKDATINATLIIYDLNTKTDSSQLDTDLDQYYNEYKFSLELSKDEERYYTFEISDRFISDSNVIFIIQIDDSCYTENEKLKLSLSSLVIDAKHMN